MISIHLDWLRWTCKYPEGVQEQAALTRARRPEREFDYTGEIFTPGQGYTRGRRLYAGSITWHHENKAQGIGVLHTGQELQMIRNGGVDEHDYLQWIQGRGGKVSTMDACINVHQHKANPLDIIKAHEAGVLQTRARTIGQFASSTKRGVEWQRGDTVYIGSTSSPVQVMVYNKAAEQGIDGDWIRIEITWRGKHAQAAHSAMVQTSIAAVTRASIAHQLMFTSEWWAYAMHGDTSQPEKVRKETGGRAKWLKESVLPALQKEVDEQRKDGNEEVYNLFRDFVFRNAPKG